MSTDTVEKVKMTGQAAVSAALFEAMEKDPKVLVFGEDVADREGGGVMGTTRGLSAKFGDLRVRSTPIAEQSIIGAAIGAGLLWIGVSLAAAQARYKTLLSVLMHSYITYILFALISVVVLTMRGVESVTSLADLRPPLGLDLVAPGASLAFAATAFAALSCLALALLRRGYKLRH